MGMRVLDIGCGNGYFTHLFSNVVGVDIVKPNLPKLKNISFVLCDAQYLPFKEKSFNGIVVMEIIEHVTNPIQLFDEVYRCLEPKGKFLLICDVYSFSLAYASFCLKILLRNLGHKHTVLSDKRDYVFVQEDLLFKALNQHFSLIMKTYCRGFIVNFLMLITNFILSTIYIIHTPQKQTTKSTTILKMPRIKLYAKYVVPLLRKLAKKDYGKKDSSCLITLFERK